MAGAGSKVVQGVAKAAPRLTLRQKIWNAMSDWTKRNSGYRQYGLLRQDLYDDNEFEVFAEAIRRLPELEANQRTYRIRRAIDLSLKHRILPRDQWTTNEEDVAYLTPYIKEAEKDIKEQKQWKNL